MPTGRNSSGLWPAEASRPIPPETCESTIQKSPCGVDSTRGARSRTFAGARDVHSSFGGFTCESAEMMRSFAMVGLLLREVLTDPARPVHPGSGRDARLAFRAGFPWPALSAGPGFAPALPISLPRLAAIDGARAGGLTPRTAASMGAQQQPPPHLSTPRP